MSEIQNISLTLRALFQFRLKSLIRAIHVVDRDSSSYIASELHYWVFLSNTTSVHHSANHARSSNQNHRPIRRSRNDVRRFDLKPAGLISIYICLSFLPEIWMLSFGWAPCLFPPHSHTWAYFARNPPLERMNDITHPENAMPHKHNQLQANRIHDAWCKYMLSNCGVGDNSQS